MKIIGLKQFKDHNSDLFLVKHENCCNSYKARLTSITITETDTSFHYRTQSYKTCKVQMMTNCQGDTNVTDTLHPILAGNLWV